MEAAALSAAVSGTLKIVGNKLAPLVIKKYSSIVGVEKDLQELQGLADRINCWLQTGGAKAIQVDPSVNWLKNLEDLAYDVDDVVDEFQLAAEKYEHYGGTVEKAKLLMSRWNAASKIKEIKKRFSEIVKQRTGDSAIENALHDGHPVHCMNQTAVEIPLPNVDEASVLGRDQEKNQIISKLEEIKDQQEIKIVSIVGLGGSGKTTLAKLVFNDGDTVKKLFEVRLWIPVSQEFNVKKLFEKLFEAVSSDRSEHHSLNHMSEKISEKLTGKRFLLVLDDIWIEDRAQWQQLWEQFLVHLKSAATTSKILLTTRSRRVAEAAESTDVFDLPLLAPDDSWQLFTRRFHANMPSDFEEVGKEIVKKCGGVPLAIIALACVLRDKELKEEWEAIRDNSLLDVGGTENGIFARLRLSYLHLPLHLKPCFTICSLFPKGYKIDKEQLIDQWIAHDMIAVEDGVSYLEYTAEKYFNSLVQMSFLQDVEENYHRGVKCRMHDLVHDLARSILGDKISLAVPNEATNSMKSYRYFSLTEQKINPPPENLFRKARAIYVDKGYNETRLGKALMKARRLRSVTVECNYERALPTAVLQIENLKYLEISRLHCEEIPEAISDLWSLQALHLTCRNLVELPESIGKLRKLRTLNLSQCEQLKCLPDSIGDCQMISSIDLCNCRKLMKLPSSIGKLQNLRMLNLWHCKGLICLPDSIGDCQMISSIDLYNCRNFTVLPNSIGTNEKLSVLRLGSTKIKRLPSSITTLRNLECLDLHDCGELVELPEGFSNLEKLEVLNLVECGNLRGMPVGIRQLSRLQKLELFVVGENEKCARIFELANIGRNSEDLTIRGTVCVMEPVDAHKACLKQKTNLQRLCLEWRRYPEGEVNTELVQAVLDGLEPPSGLKELRIDGYLGRQYARWMQDDQVGGGLLQGLPLAHFPFLRVMNLCDFPNLKHLCGLAELPCLEEFELCMMPSLESISGGPFPSLVKISMRGMPSLGEVWMVAAERTIPDGKEGGGCSNRTAHHLGQVLLVGNCFRDLSITDCPKLKVKPCLPSSVQVLWLSGSSKQLLQSPGQCDGSSSSYRFSQMKKLMPWEMAGSGSGRGWELLQYMTALESLEIRYCHDVPQSLGSLTSLRTLYVLSCSAVRELPESLGELRSLQQLTIKGCSCLSSLPQSMGRLTSLRSLEVYGCFDLETLPESLGELGSLQELIIQYCCSLSRLPQTMGGLTSLEVLRIQKCDALEQLPECLGDLHSLRELEIKRLEGLTCLPQSMCGLTSLENLYVENCPGIKSLPEGIKRLVALQELCITGCPDLNMRCEEGKGEDWHLISHIPHMWIYFC